MILALLQAVHVTVAPGPDAIEIQAWVKLGNNVCLRTNIASVSMAVNATNRVAKNELNLRITKDF